MRFIHTSDWHLGRIFHGFHLTDDQAYILHELERLVNDSRPDAYIVSGDIYDRAVPPLEAVELLDEHLSRIVLELKVPVIIISGNHDSGSRIGFASRLMADRGLFIRGGCTGPIEPVVIEDEHGSVYVYPVPYMDPEAGRACLGDDTIRDHNSLMAAVCTGIKQQHPHGSRSVAAGHCFIQGGKESESERPLSIGGSGAVDPACFGIFDYAALGHLHRPQAAGGSEKVQYSGSLMKYSLSEAGHRKSVSLVEMDRAGTCTVERTAIIPRHELNIIKGHFDDILKGHIEGVHREDYVAVTLLDRASIYDAMNRLREVYPNIVHLQRKELEAGDDRGKRIDHNRMSEHELFYSFYRDVTGDEPDDAGNEVFGAAVSAVREESL